MNKKIMASIGILGLCAVLLASGLTPQPTANVKDGVNEAGFFVLEITHADGTKEYRETHNTVTNIGKNITRDSVMGLNDIVNGVKYLELSNGTGAPAATDDPCPVTLVTGLGLDISAGTVTVVGADAAKAIGNYSVSKVWTATGISEAISKICISNDSASGGDFLFASALISPVVNLANGDQLNATYYITVT